MAYSEFEQSFMDSYARSEFPGLFEPQPVQVAQASGATKSDAPPAAAGTVQQAEMKAYDPTMRERLSAFLQAGFEGLGMERSQARKNAQSIMGGPSSGAPLGLGVADLVPFLGTALQTQEALRSLDDAATFASQGEYGDAALETAVAGIGLIPGAAGTAKAVKTVAKRGKKKAAAAAALATPTAVADDKEKK